MINEKSVSVGDIAAMRTQLMGTMEKITSQGITTVLGIGGMNLDYAGYPLPEGMSLVLAYHTAWQELGHIGELYETTIDILNAEFKVCGKQITFINQLMEHDYRMSEIALCNPVEMEMMNGVNWRDTLHIDYDEAPGYGLFGEDLLKEFIEKEKIIIGYNMNRHHKLFKSSYVRNKKGLKINVTRGDTKYLMHGQPVRENLIIK